MIKKLAKLSLLGWIISISMNIQAITLNEVIEQTILSNPSILEQYNQKISREYEVKVAHGDYLPQIDFDTSAGFKRVENETTRANGNGEPDLYNTWNAQITLKQMLFDGYLTRSEKARQNKRVESAFFELYNLAEETGIAAIRVYTNVLLYKQYVTYAEQNLLGHEKMFDQIEMRSLLGADDKSALSQSRGRLNLALSNVESEKNNLQDRWTEYLEVVGFLPKDAMQDVEFTIALPETYEETLDYALANHPALARSKAVIEQFKLQKKSSKSFYYPRVELELNSRWERNSAVDNSNVGLRSNEQAVLLNLNWNLYNGGADKARVDKDQFLRQEADEHLEWQRRRVEKDVSYAWNTYKVSDKRLKFLAEYVSSTEETSVSYLEQFKIGERTLLDLLNIENEVFESRKEFLKVKYENILAKYRVLASMGTLLEKIRIKVMTDEYYEADDINKEVVNDLPEKDKGHDNRELEKRDSSDKYTDMRFTKMNNNLRPETQRLYMKKMDEQKIANEELLTTKEEMDTTVEEVEATDEKK